MKPITIIRIEHKESGLGMFQTRSNKGRWNIFTGQPYLIDQLPLKRLNNRHEKLFPAPFKDSLINRDALNDEFCAFKSIEQVQKWITPREIKILVNNGFRILELKVTNYTVGEYQVLFYKDSIVKSRDITHIF